MNWIDIGMAGGIGAISALIAQLLVGKPKEKRVAFAIVLGISFILLISLSTKFIRPEINKWYQSRKVNEALLEISACKEIKQYDPQLYELVRREISSSIQNGLPEKETVSKVRILISQGAAKYIPLASDEALMGFAKVAIEIMEQLTLQDPNLTYMFLFPQQYGTLSVGKYVTKETQDKLLDSLANIV